MAILQQSFNGENNYHNELYDPQHDPLQDPKNLDNILSRELLKMSFKERIGIQEEIHGVECLAREETPEFLEQSLQSLEHALNDPNMVPYHIKSSYRRAQDLPNSYVNSRGFRLRFLRNTRFDVAWAARKVCEYLMCAEDFFGEQTLQRPIQYRDLTSKERQYLRKGHVQFLPFRDRSGRRILSIVNATLYNGNSLRPLLEMSQEERNESTLYMQCKCLMYMVWSAGDDVDTQRRGIIYLGWFDPSFNPKFRFDLKMGIIRLNYTRIFTVRPSAIHICFPDRPVYRFFRKLIMVQGSQPNRPKMIFHLGEPIELRYKLNSYGIPTDHIPISVTGTIKVGYVKQWMRAREVIEEKEYRSRFSMNNCGDYDDERDNNLSIVECPQLEDVLFRQGISLNTNPGNAMIRRLIIKAYKDQNIRVKRRKMVLTILEEVRKSGGRFLMWNEEGWWNELLLNNSGAEDLLVAKVEYVIKDVRRENRISIRQQQQQLKTNSSTSMFCAQDGTRSSASSRNNCITNYNNCTPSDSEESSNNLTKHSSNFFCA
eukprot:CAMPEP_0172390554 /NCGR_PEP_ID=MMETSP1061-20121228/7171_1 /TAXON_ID=37318 /ORGANISM="Pseudo-nitzschia pungens, Strain cf. pungens" /LENGTH=541 /DNA_ID=CAMNT_0013120959 /DNA_START=243 /DNA_END=1868 /DNA_ORIENTATION=-